jgi:hypothetical protein
VPSPLLRPVHRLALALAACGTITVVSLLAATALFGLGWVGLNLLMLPVLVPMFGVRLGALYQLASVQRALDEQRI